MAANALTEAKRAYALAESKQQVGPAGERGLKGDAGRDAVSIPGRDGKDGVGYSGAVGPQGRAGKDCVCASASAITDAVQKLNAATAEIVGYRQEVADLKFTVKALKDMNSKASDYIAFLQQRVADRMKQ